MSVDDFLLFSVSHDQLGVESFNMKLSGVALDQFDAVE